MSGEHLLVVEDDPALLQGVRDILELAGYQVSTGSNGLEGLAVLDKVRPQLIVSDIMMPRMDGYRFFEAVRARPECFDLPFIFLTAKGERADIRRGKQLGADDYVTKPFDEEDLLVAVRAKLERRAQLQAARTREMSELKRTILTTLNHEFRTPLTYITSYTDLLRDSGPETNPEDFQKILRGIQMGSERLRRLVEDFILLVELQAGEAEQSFQRRRRALPDLPNLLSLALARQADAAAARQVRLECELDPGLPALWADPEYLIAALNRLLENAIKFSKKAGGPVKVRVTTNETRNRIRLEVHDQGIGIPPEALNRLFDVFYQIDRAKHEQQGSGSGLAIARGVAALHGGELRVESAVDAGSIFTLELPLGGAEDAAARPQPAA